MQKIKTALSAYGMSGKLFHAPFIHLHHGFELTAACERVEKRIGINYPGVKSYDDFSELLNNRDVELVIINSPNYTHFDFANRALMAGKHVVVEKPFCTSTAECDELCELAKEKNKLISVYQNRRWDSDFKTVKKIVDEKLLGEIVEAEIHFDRYEEQLSYKLHKETPGPGAGIIYDLGPHLIDQALLLFGMPEALFADLSIMRRISRVDDYMELILFYEGSRVRLKAGYLVREAPPAYQFHGSRGSFIKTRGDVQEGRLKQNHLPGTGKWGVESELDRGILHTSINGKLVRKLIHTEIGNYGEFYDLLFEAIRHDAAVPVSATEGRNVIKIIEMAIRSNKERRIVMMN